MRLYDLVRRDSPLVVSFPHSGTHVPEEIFARFTEAARALPDTDWHVPELYGFAAEFGATTLSATHSRYCADLNRPPSGEALYPGRHNTGMMALRTFRDEAVYRAGEEPDAAEIALRRESYWRPYHEALAAELARVKARHGFALLWDAHSIASELPWLFEGRLPDFNIGTNSGASCDRAIEEAVAHSARKSGFSSVLNGRFTGGYITRHYGKPDEGVHAVQLEMTQAIYMEEEAPYRLRFDAAEGVTRAIRGLVAAALQACAALRPKAF